MSTSSTTCPECGARLPDEATRCDLCGASVEPERASEHAAPEAASTPPKPAEPSDADTTGGTFCNECGWKNPPGARFCSQCGTELQDLTGATPPVSPQSNKDDDEIEPEAPPKTKPAELPVAPAADDVPAKTTPEHPAEEDGDDAKTEQKAISRQVGVIVGAGAMLVLALFLITAVSKDRTAPAPVAEGETTTERAPTGDVMAQADAPPLPPQVETRVEELRAQIEQGEGEAQRAARMQLVNLLEGNGRLDLAAIEQKEIAEAEDTPDAWRRAGDLFYDWMNVVEGERKIEIADQAIAAYEKTLAEEPDNLDVQTDMAVAYLSSGDPMQGVTLIKEVIDTDSTHVTARFNYGAMLAMIGRAEQAISEFEAVKRLNTPESPYYQRADQAIQSIRARMDS